MITTKKNKKNIIHSIQKISKNSISAIAVNYYNITANQMNEIRYESRKCNVHIKVINNNLAKIAFQKTKLCCLNEKLIGPIFIAFSCKEYCDAAKLLKKFIKKFDNLKIIALSIDNNCYSADIFEKIVNLPSKKEAIRKIAFALSYPMIKLIKILMFPSVKLAKTILLLNTVKK